MSLTTSSGRSASEEVVVDVKNGVGVQLDEVLSNGGVVHQGEVVPHEKVVPHSDELQDDTVGEDDELFTGIQAVDMEVAAFHSQGSNSSSQTTDVVDVEEAPVVEEVEEGSVQTPKSSPRKCTSCLSP